jgi:DNA ligase-1
MTKDLNDACLAIENLFEAMHGVNASTWQKNKVEAFKRDHPDLVDDLDFCFEVLAGKHKLGFTCYSSADPLLEDDSLYYDLHSIKDIHTRLKELTTSDKSEERIWQSLAVLPINYEDFLVKLFNREYKLGYSNRKNMVTNLHCMLAKKYPEGVKTTKDYYIQEKLNGNRCIAWYDFSQDKWRFTSRSQKEKFYPFDMSKLSKDHVYDGEVMSRNAMGNRDFAKTSGLANSKYGDKSQLVYIIYDILDDSLPYKERWKILSGYVWLYYTENRVLFKETSVSENVAILPLLGKVTVSTNVADNIELDRILDEIVDAGGEGIMLRDPDAPYHHSAGSGNRKNYLLKYKKLKTCDLRIIGWNNGKGKYEGYIGSFICETDDHNILVNVAGIDDDIRMSDPNLWIGKIIEVAYFDVSKSSSKNTSSLQFPRYVRTRRDKDETSMF